MSEEEWGSSDSDIDEEAVLAGQEDDNLRGVGDDIYNREEIHEKLEDIMWVGATFSDAYVIEGQEAESIPDIEDDLQRELSFYNQALASARTAVGQLDKEGIPWQRPPDYYAEMVKSDGHMSRIKEQLVYEQKQIEQTDERRKQREAKKHNKQIQAERQKEKAQAKKSNIESVSKLRRQRQKSGFAGELDMDAELARMDRQKGNNPHRISQSRTPISKKRESKNAKFGFGGRKRLNKQNDASSAANMDGYRKKKAQKGGKSPQRPGKSRRQERK